MIHQKIYEAIKEALLAENQNPDPGRYGEETLMYFTDESDDGIGRLIEACTTNVLAVIQANITVVVDSEKKS